MYVGGGAQTGTEFRVQYRNYPALAVRLLLHLGVAHSTQSLFATVTQRERSVPALLEGGNVA
jgi:hypothetical protein